MAEKMKQTAVVEPRLQVRYREEIQPAVMKHFGIDNVMSAPGIEKIVLNMGLGAASGNIKILDTAVEELTAMAGQRAVVTRARKSIAAFKLREGMPIGCRVTLRRERMWEFLDRLISVSLPRVRDFRGLSPKSFDRRGNYTLGVQDHLIFPEVENDANDGSKGLNVSIVTTTDKDDQALYMLTLFGMPFRKLNEDQEEASS